MGRVPDRRTPAILARPALRAQAALDLCLTLDVQTVLDIGCGSGDHAKVFRAAGKKVTTISLGPADIVGEYVGQCGQHDLVWASHVLEHQRNVGEFLDQVRRDAKKWIAITVPPMKDEVVGGHVALFNAGILLYHMILAGIDCRRAKVKTYGYNISVVVENKSIRLPKLACDAGDIERLAEFFPVPVKQGFDGRIASVNWA